MTTVRFPTLAFSKSLGSSCGGFDVSPFSGGVVVDASDGSTSSAFCSPEGDGSPVTRALSLLPVLVLSDGAALV